MSRADLVHKVARDPWVTVAPQDSLVLLGLPDRRATAGKLVVMVTRVNLGLVVTKGPWVLLDPRALVVSPVPPDFLVPPD